MENQEQSSLPQGAPVVAARPHTPTHLATGEDPRLQALTVLAKHCRRDVHCEYGADGPRLVSKQLMMGNLERHLSGGAAIGLYPMLPGSNTTRVAVLDLDDHEGAVGFEKMSATAKVLYEELLGHGINATPVRSKNGRGVHLIVLWPTEQDSYSVRECLRICLAQCGLKTGTRGVRHGEIEAFPKQNEIAPDKFGSMFCLPWAGQSVLLDVGDFQPQVRPLTSFKWPMSAPVEVLEHPLPPVKRAPAELAPNLARLREDLEKIPNEGIESLSYEEWRNVIFGLHHATGGSDEGLALAHEFSARSHKYDSDVLDSRVWPYIDANRPNAITERTIAHMARQNEDPADDFDVLPAQDNQASPDSPAGAPDSPVAGIRFPGCSAPEFAERPAPEWIVRDVLPRAELGMIYGESGSGKSFLALDLVAAVVRGEAWCGHKTKQGPVFYIAAEGAGGFRNRLLAYSKHHSATLDQLIVFPHAPNLMQPNDVKALLEAFKPHGRPRVIVIDTVATTTPGEDENSSAMGKALAHCRALHRATGATVVLIHHSGKDATKGARGWSGLRAAVDCEIEITRRGDERLARITKQKDGQDGGVYPFKLIVVPIGEDADGEAIDSCVVEHIEATPTVRKRPEPRGPKERVVWTAVHDIAELCGEVTVEAVIKEAISKLTKTEGPKDRRRYVVRRALEGLADRGLLAIRNDLVIVGHE